jgi:hypothetical protein
MEVENQGRCKHQTLPPFLPIGYVYRYFKVSIYTNQAWPVNQMVSVELGRLGALEITRKSHLCYPTVC